MSRDLTVDTLAAFGDGQVRPVLFYEGVFSAGTLRLWSGVGTVTWNSQSWVGAGQLLGVSPFPESSEIKATGITLSLSGMTSEVVALALAQARLGLAGRVWLGAMTSAGAIIADPYLAFSGRLDRPVIDDDGQTATVTVSYESRLIDLERPRIRRWTHEDQRIDYPSDRGFEYVPTLQDQVLTW